MLEYESILLLTCNYSSVYPCYVQWKSIKNNSQAFSAPIGAQTFRLCIAGPCWKIECGCLPPVLGRNVYQYSDQLLAVRPEIGLAQYRSLKLIIASKYFRCAQTGWDLKIIFYFLNST